jgi:hypothetical protein
MTIVPWGGGAGDEDELGPQPTNKRKSRQIQGLNLRLSLFIVLSKTSGLTASS